MSLLSAATPLGAQQLRDPSTAPAQQPRVSTRVKTGPAQPRQPGTPAADSPAARQAAVPRTQPAQPRQQGLPPAPPVAVPFKLTPEEQADLDAMLSAWEKRSEKVTLFRSKIKRWEYDKVFNKNTVALGEIKYKAPDRGLYKVWDEKSNNVLEHWRCDGQAIYEFNYEKKQLIERKLPPEMQGKAIADGPLPFIFGAKAQTLKDRYFLRLKPPLPSHQDKICVEAYPRLQADAANFQRAELLLTQQGMLPFALQLDLPNGKSVTVHQFYDVKTNDPIGIVKGDFDAPGTPLGWKKIVEGENVPPGDEPSITTVPTPAKPGDGTLRR